MTSLFGVGDEFGEDAILGKLEGMKDVIEQVNKQFKDPVRSYIQVFLLLECVVYVLPFVVRHNRRKTEQETEKCT